jgi:hypothetical protein
MVALLLQERMEADHFDRAEDRTVFGELFAKLGEAQH